MAGKVPALRKKGLALKGDQEGQPFERETCIDLETKSMRVAATIGNQPMRP